MNKPVQFKTTVGKPNAIFFRSILILSFLLLVFFQSNAQNTVSDTVQSDSSTVKSDNNNIVVDSTTNKSFITPQQKILTKLQIKRREKAVEIGSVVGYGSIMYGLISIRYTHPYLYGHYPMGQFHTYNNFNDWLQVNTMGHVYSSYIEGLTNMELWRWAGMDRKQSIWLGGLTGTAFQTSLEVLDGFNTHWGFSWSDFGANLVGTAAFIAQELTWNEQKINLKFSAHNNDNYYTTHYDDGGIAAQRADEIFGNGLAQRLVSDYNAQTYWVSTSLSNLLPNMGIPDWIAISVGYGASGMFSPKTNYATDSTGVIYDETATIQRHRVWYLAPDIDLTKIKTHNKALKFIFTTLNAFKIPLPALSFSNGQFQLKPIQF